LLYAFGPGAAYGATFVLLAGGVLLAALCLFGFTIAGSILVERLTWLKPVAGVVLILIGGKLAFDYFRG
jgi:cytochrome c biogenesis protein CcdA